MALQLLDAEQFRTQQLGIPVVVQPVMCACRKAELIDDYDFLLVSTTIISAASTAG
jgi:hydroxymethylpyrimidine/phosphomethylpyrimidine kinase